MNKFANSLRILRGLNKDEIFLYATKLFEDRSTQNENDFAYAVFNASAHDRVIEYILNLIKYDENAFSHACAKTKEVSPSLLTAFICDLEKIYTLLNFISNLKLFDNGTCTKPFNLSSAKATALSLIDFYNKNGYGNFAKYKAFVYRNNQLLPVKHPSTIQLSDLKDYAEEKRLIINNVSDFLNDLPYSHTLLYGDKGTGKSSTVHATLNKFSNDKLKLIEISKEDLSHLKELTESICNLPLKFIIFIDDLSFNDGEMGVSSLKATIEGSIVNGNNIMIIATSNRRHILSENFSDRENALHPTDLREEQLSLSDRFGLTVVFSSTTKDGYLSIVRQLAEQYKLKLAPDELEKLAERWTIFKGGRSPRRAEQFVRLAYACQESGREIEF